jgi:hypothetical protein
MAYAVVKLANALIAGKMAPAWDVVYAKVRPALGRGIAGEDWEAVYDIWWAYGGRQRVLDALRGRYSTSNMA